MGWKAAAISLVLSCSAMADATSTQALGAAGIDPTATSLNYMLNCQGCHAADGRGLNDIPTMADFVERRRRTRLSRAGTWLGQFTPQRSGPCGRIELDFTDHECSATAAPFYTLQRQRSRWLSPTATCRRCRHTSAFTREIYRQ